MDGIEGQLGGIDGLNQLKASGKED